MKYTNIRFLSFGTSIILHLSLIGITGNNGWIGKFLHVIPIEKKDSVALEFISVPDEAIEEKIKKGSKIISDKSVKAHDTIKEEIKEKMARTKIVSKGKQTAKISTQKTIVSDNKLAKKQKVQDKRKDMEKKQVPQEILLKQQSQKKVEYDIVNIPEVSESIFSAPEDGHLSFETQVHKIGPYFKLVKKNIENYWLRYLIFKYQNTAPEESEAVVAFKILPSGEVAGVRLLEFSGDILFKDFCIASIVNTAPFPPLPENLKDELKKEGGLNIVFTFRYR